MTDLDLHPAAEVVPEEVGGDGVEHVHLVRLERHSLLVKVVPELEERIGPDVIALRATDCNRFASPDISPVRWCGTPVKL